MRRVRGLIIGSCLVLAFSLAACEREERQFRELPPLSGRVQPVRLTDLQPGSPLPARVAGSPYENNSYGISEGQRLYQWYNCSGCHFQGGGGIGPPLMDDKWIYGGSPQNIYDTVVEGRPNGMPSYGGHIPDDQLWKIVAYVRSLSGQVPKPAAPTRSDQLMGRPSPQATKEAEPKSEKARHPG
ncbi:MAG TPA: cytochrome c [Thermoanaerobaculia bacterium]|jgi:cytochrome c oxidase cbb3-type subunit 3